MRRRLLVATTVVLLGATHLVGPALTPASAGCADVTVPLRTFKLEAKWTKSSYKIGSVAKLQVTVTRTADEDPVTEEGMPWPTGRPADEPAEGVNLGVALFVGEVYLNGGAVTDASGKATVPVKIESYAKPGTGNGRVYGEKILIDDFPDSSCRVLIKEFGNLDPIDKVKITG